MSSCLGVVSSPFLFRASENIQGMKSACVRILDKHTDLISSCGILAITTCLLCANIFKGMPSFLPKMSRIVFNYGGIIWLNVQLRDLVKTGQDWLRVVELKEWKALFDTSLKVAIKVFNIFLTCCNFTCSIISGVGFPHISLAVQLFLRPWALASLAATIFCDIRDYFINESIIKQFDQIEAQENSFTHIAEIVIVLLEEIKDKQRRSECSNRVFANKIIRQLHHSTVETFQENLTAKNSAKELRREALKFYFSIKDSLQNTQSWTKSNLSLTVFNYIAMALCRAFPETLIEWGTRWTSSVLYTDELLRKKLFESDLASRL